MNKNLIRNIIITIGAIAIALTITTAGFFIINRGWLGINLPIMNDDLSVSRFIKNEPLSFNEVESAIESYLTDYRDTDLHISEIMIFDNHAYAEIVESDTGVGAMEVLVDPSTLSVYPEYGPNMMWNQKYGHMRGNMMGGGFNGGIDENYSVMPISNDEAVKIAQDYLSSYAKDLDADDHADPFYGYYTIHTIKEGEVYGMLSVNGYNGRVFIHSWHGDFIEMSDHDEI